MNAKSTGAKVATTAGRALSDTKASGLQKSLAGSALAQAGTGKVTSKAMETKASNALKSANSSPRTRELAGSVTAQARKKP